MTDNKAGKENAHSVKSAARTKTEISGVEEVESFDEGCVVLHTLCGEMTIEGEELRVGTLDMERGVVVVDGKINGIYYSDGEPKKRGLRARFFG